MRVTDYLTGKKAGKGSYFPLIDEAARAIDKEHEDGEHPLLLDPVFSADCKLLCFDSSNGKPIPRYTKEEDEVRHERAMASIDYYHLDEGTWNKDRKDLMDDIATLCDKILEAAKKGAEGRAEYDGLVSELLRYLDSFSEFTSAAYQIAREKGILELLYPIPA